MITITQCYSTSLTTTTPDRKAAEPYVRSTNTENDDEDNYGCDDGDNKEAIKKQA